MEHTQASIVCNGEMQATEISGSHYQHRMLFAAMTPTAAILKQPLSSAVLLVVNHRFTA